VLRGVSVAYPVSVATLAKQDPNLLIDGRPVRGIITTVRDLIDVTPQFEADPYWVHVDSHGHSHRWMAGPDPLVPLRNPAYQTPVLPSLVQVEDSEPHWCDLCAGDYQPRHYECVVCADIVEPRMRPTVTRRHIPGVTHVSFDVDEPLPIGAVTVTVLSDPPQVFDGYVTNREHRSDGYRMTDGSWRSAGTAHIEAQGAPRAAAS
jgi:hypothetical protein